MLRILTYFILLSLFPLCSQAKGKKADDALPDFFAVADSFRTKQWNYECLYYFSGRSNLRRRNFLYFTLPNRGYYRRGGRELLTEQVGVQQYNRVTSFTRKIRYKYGSVDDYDMASQEVMNLFLQTPYYSYLLGGDHILSPFAKENAKYYRYSLDSISGGKMYYSYRAKRNKTQLSLSGTFTYDRHSRSITHYTFRGYYGYTTFKVKVKMGEKGNERYWPAQSEADFHYYFYGNIIDGHALFSQDYYTMEDSYDPSKILRRNRNDLTPLYSLSLDTTKTRHDSLAIAHYRSQPLDSTSNKLYDEAAHRWRRSHVALAQDEVIDKDTIRRTHTQPWVKTLGTIGESVFNSYNFTTSQYSKVHVSSPDLSYSDWRGVTYQQDASIQLNHTSGRSLKTDLRVGYNFRPQQVVGRLITNFTYLPSCNAAFSLTVHHRGVRGSTDQLSLTPNFDDYERAWNNDDAGNQIAEEIASQTEFASSMTRAETAAGTDGKKPLPSYQILFRDFMVRLEHNIDIMNGLRLSAGVIYHDRMPHHVSDEVLKLYDIKKHYTSFSPHINIVYTPAQQYFYNDGKKVVVGSRWPTFMLDYERGTSGVLNSDAHFERWEATVTKRQMLSPLYMLMWKIGGGLFTNRYNIDFIFYEYFNEGITDPTWGDALSGCFHSLNGRYYDNCYRYLRMHAVLESPNLILGKISTYLIRGERLYLGLLATDRLFPYVELGYGLSTHIIDISFFTSIAKKEAVRSGVKFTLHLFD